MRQYVVIFDMILNCKPLKKQKKCKSVLTNTEKGPQVELRLRNKKP